MTKKQLKMIVSLFNTGSCTYQTLAQAFPTLTPDDWYELIEDNFLYKPKKQQNLYASNMFNSFDDSYPDIPRVNYDQAILRFSETPLNYYSDYIFLPTDTFVLSERGQDLYDEIIESRKQTSYNIAMLILAAIAAITGIISCIN